LVINGGLNGRLDSVDSIEFYATALDTPTTNRRTYYLVYGAQAGRRVAVVPGSKGAQSRRRSFTSTGERRDRCLYCPSVNTAAGGELVQVSGFTTAGVRVFDLTDEQNPVELKPLVEAEGKTYRATVAPQESGERLLLALSDKGYGQGAQVVAQQPSAWHDASQ